MGFWDNMDDIGRVNSFGSANSFSKIFDYLNEANTAKTKNFDKYRSEIKKIRAYIKSQREAFYKDNNLKER